VFRRVLIANRGEVAVRIVRACHELGVEAVAVYSTADRESLHVRLADHAVHVGPPPSGQSYLNIPSLVAAATTTGCEAVHPGWGFLAENAEFAAACEGNDLAFVGPRPETIEVMGDKIRAKEAVAAAGLPLVPGSDGAATLEQARALAADVGFPLLLKAAAGGGGRGMRLVTAADELEPAFQTAASEAQVPGQRFRRPRAQPHVGGAVGLERGGEPLRRVDDRLGPAEAVHARAGRRLHEGIVDHGQLERRLARRRGRRAWRRWPTRR